MSESLIPILLFVVAIAFLPWLVRHLQGKMGAGLATQSSGKVVSALAVGPQQRVVTVKLNHGAEELTMVLGVTASSVTCLHKWGAGVETGAGLEASPAESTK